MPFNIKSTAVAVLFLWMLLCWHKVVPRAIAR